MSNALMARVAIILILATLAFSTRLLPIAISPYPYNNDGVTEARIANDILESGSISYPEGSFYVNTHSEITPVFNVFLAYVSSMTGISPFYVVQVVIAVIAVTTIVGAYVVANQIVGSRKGAMAAALFLSLFGTFVYLTGSTWKESLGTALIMLLVYAYINRDDKRMATLQIAILVMLPFVHHLVTIIAFLTIAYLTAWSWFFALRNGSLKRRHVLDLISIAVPSIIAFSYYRVFSLDRFSDFVEGQGTLTMALTIIAFVVITIAILGRKSKARMTTAPIAVVLLATFVLWNHFESPFQYISGTPDYIIILLISSCLIVGIAWFGIERLLGSKSLYRTIPIGLLLPVLTLTAYALIKGSDLASHQVLYRTFDFADIAFAVGIAASVGHMSRRPRAEKLIVAAVIAAVVFSFPFGYYTECLVGVRHDTQEYEVDAIEWVDTRYPSSTRIHSDERLAYDARALYDFEKCPFLPSNLDQAESLSRTAVNMLEEEWTTVGVNDYPYGHPVLDAAYVASVLAASDVTYVGGPASNSIILFTYSSIGQSYAGE